MKEWIVIPVDTLFDSLQNELNKIEKLGWSAFQIIREGEVEYPDSSYSVFYSIIFYKETETVEDSLEELKKLTMEIKDYKPNK